MLLLSIFIFVILLLVLVVVHELGHFMVAKWAGCKVEEFGFGLPPRLFGWKRGETLYSINALPIGGFVKIEGEDGENTSNSSTHFATKPAAWRIGILAAGVTMNILLAAVLLTIQAGIGYPTIVSDGTTPVHDLKTYIVDISPNSPAAAAELKPLDRIVRLEAVMNPSLEVVQQTLHDHAGLPLTLEIERQGQHHTVTVTPRRNPPQGQGALGVSLAATGLTKVPWWQTPWYGLKKTGEMLLAIVWQFSLILKQLVTQGTMEGSLTGPIGIAVYANEVTKLGVSYLLEFAAMISLNLALINILPFPALDGGRIMFVFFEKLRGGRRLPIRAEQVTHTIGFAVLILLMIVITFQDIRKFF